MHGVPFHLYVLQMYQCMYFFWKSIEKFSKKFCYLVESVWKNLKYEIFVLKFKTSKRVHKSRLFLHLQLYQFQLKHYAKNRPLIYRVDFQAKNDQRQKMAFNISSRLSS